jgi:chromate reductase
MVDRNIVVLVGSLRRGSLNRRLASALAGVAPPGLAMNMIEIGALEMYDQDLDSTPPRSWQEFRDRIRSADAVLFVTPEYNRSVPAALKNAIDVGSRPYGQSVWSGKPGAVISASPSAMGGFGANHHLRQMLVFLDVPVLQQPEAYIGHVDRLLDENGAITSDASREFLTRFMGAFAAWIETIMHGRQ